MKGYLAFPPTSFSASNPAQLSKLEPTQGACTLRNKQGLHGCTGQHGEVGGGYADETTLEGERRKRREQERVLGERSEIEWVRAGGILRDAFGRRDVARTERIRQELRTQDVERQRMARWEAYEARWCALQGSSLTQTSPISFVEFPWPLKECVSSRDLNALTRAAVSEFLFETLTVRTNITTKKERIRNSLLRWHPDKTSPVLNRVVPGDLELVREGIHVVFGILKPLQDEERTGTL